MEIQQQSQHKSVPWKTQALSQIFAFPCNWPSASLCAFHSEPLPGWRELNKTYFRLNEPFECPDCGLIVRHARCEYPQEIKHHVSGGVSGRQKLYPYSKGETVEFLSVLRRMLRESHR